MILNNKNLFNIAFIVLGAILSASADAAVVSRGNATKPAVASRAKAPANLTKTNTATAAKELKPAGSVKEDKVVANKKPELDTVESAEKIFVEDKSSQFDEIFGNTAGTTNTDTESSAFAKQIRAQRDALNARDAENMIAAQVATGKASGNNTCDNALRTCMQSKCGKDYTKCAGDTDTSWGDKMDSCRRDTTCTGHEYALFAPEIKADRDMNARVAQYNAIVDCGNKYNSCVVEKCGLTFGKCLGKSAGDKVIQECSKIAKECQEQDSGLPSRMMNAFGILRQDAEKQVAKDEEKLYALRDEMASTCKQLGAMFDARTLDCVYTVNFHAGEDNTLYASKKLYAGSTFNCEPNWFGIDVTTFMENAFRLTREQKSASSAMMGAGIGVGVGALTSGALDRAIERTKAEKELKKAQDDDDKSSTKEERQANRDKNKDAKDECKKTGGKWKNGECVKSNKPEKKKNGTETSASAASANTQENNNESQTEEELTPEQIEEQEAFNECMEGGDCGDDVYGDDDDGNDDDSDDDDGDDVYSDDDDGELGYPD